MKLLTIASVACAMIVGFASCSGDKKADAATDSADNAIAGELPVYNIPFAEKSRVDKQHKSVLIISASPRKGGNTDLLCDEFMKGALEAGGNVEKIFLDDYKIDFFHAQHEEHPDTIVPGDDAPVIIARMEKADIIVLSSPVYYMNVDGQLKALMDRCYRHDGLKGKEFYYITACADKEMTTANTAIFAFRGFVSCLPEPTERGMVRAVGMGRAGAVKGTQYMKEAFELGKTI